jgi:GNAT superfamily N-acetyltransferase
MPPLEITIDTERDEDDLDVFALWHGHRVGWAQCTIEGNRLLLADIRVEDNLPRQWPCCHRFLASLGFQRSSLNLRGQGIGSRILDRVIAEAEALGVEEIYGSIVQDDIAHSPTLLQWYERHGFTVSDADHDCIRHAVKKISRKMPVSPNPSR